MGNSVLLGVWVKVFSWWVIVFSWGEHLYPHPQENTIGEHLYPHPQENTITHTPGVFLLGVCVLLGGVGKGVPPLLDVQSLSIPE